MSFAIAGISPPMRISFDEPVSVEDFWHIGAENPDLRLERRANGDLVVMTPTNRRTGFKSSLILRAVGNWAEANANGYEFDSSTAFALPDDSILSPDAAWISKDRWSPDLEDEYDTVICPDFVIELRSKSDRLADARAKMKVWVDNGVPLAWLIDPLRKAVEIYRPSREPEVVEGVSAVEGEGPVAGFVLELGRIWG